MDAVQKLALYVPPIDDDFNPDAEPLTGEEYLQRVLYERKNCPEIVSVKPKKIKNHTVQTHFLVNPSDEIKKRTSTTLLATPEWQQIQITEFRKIRQRVTELRDKYDAMGCSSTVLDFSEICQSEKWEIYCRENPPLLTIMMKIDQPLLENLLDLQLEWLTEKIIESTELDLCIDFSTNEKWLSQWIYASLACLHVPLEPNLHSILREIARNCMKIRNLLKPEDEMKVLPLNLIICIIANNFNQLDLSDCF